MNEQQKNNNNTNNRKKLFLFTENTTTTLVFLLPLKKSNFISMLFFEGVAQRTNSSTKAVNENHENLSITPSVCVCLWNICPIYFSYDIPEINNR